MHSTLSDLCKKCGKCCKCLVLPVVKPLQKAIMTDWLHVRGAEIINEDVGAVYVKVDLPCPHLQKSDEGWICDQYSNRPEGCRIFDGRHYNFLDCAWKKSKERFVVLEKGV